MEHRPCALKAHFLLHCLREKIEGKDKDKERGRDGRRESNKASIYMEEVQESTEYRNTLTNTVTCFHNNLSTETH